MPTRIERLRGLSIQQDLVEDLEDAKQRAIEQRDLEIAEALAAGISERTVAAAVRLSRSYVNKVRRLSRGTTDRAAA